MPSKVIQWFPGHMAKTRRLISESLSSVDLILEVRDARVPLSSANPDLPALIGQKPRLVLFCKSSLADPEKTEKWKKFFSQKGEKVLFVDNLTGEGFSALLPEVRSLLSEKIERNVSKGMSGKALRAMVVGIPNSGKSSLINRLAGSKKARTEDRPGVTQRKQWVPTGAGLELLDMPGVLWPKFSDRAVGLNLSFTGAVKDDVLDVLDIACELCGALRRLYPERFAARYKLGTGALPEDNYLLLRQIGKNRGFLLPGGEIDDERTAGILLDEFRGGKIGRFTLETP